jgi:hypothetical protein
MNYRGVGTYPTKFIIKPIKHYMVACCGPTGTTSAAEKKRNKRKPTGSTNRPMNNVDICKLSFLQKPSKNHVDWSETTDLAHDHLKPC